MAADEYSDLSSMDGGFHGAFDGGGALAQPGWSSLGYAQTQQPNPERTWDALAGSGD